MQILILSEDDVRAALPADACEQAMAEVLAARARGDAFNPLRMVSFPPGASGFMGLMPAYAADGADPAAFALKAICLMPGNPARGLDTHQGTVTLFDGLTGEPNAILNASAVTEIRTAAVTAVATRTLAREDARVLAILGAGVQARSHLRSLAPVRAWEQVRIYAPTEAHAREAAVHWPRGAAGAVAVTSSAEEAVRGADVVVTVTSAAEPVLAHDWLGEGVHINAVGASHPAVCELEVQTVAAAGLFCDSRESVAGEAGEFRIALAEGAIAGEEHIRAELGEVLAGVAAGRRDEQELTLFRSLGIAVEDLAAARVAVRIARERGLGTEVEL